MSEYRSLLELSSVVVTNLNKIEDLTYCKTLLEAVEGSSIEYLTELLTFADQFAQDNKKFPDKVLLDSYFPGVVGEPTFEYSKDVATHLLVEVRKSSIVERCQIELSLGRVDNAREIILKEGVVDSPYVKVSALDAVADLKKLNDRPSGIMMGCPEIDEVAKGFTYGTLTVIAAPPASFKCVVDHTRVNTSMGYRRIKDLPMLPIGVDKFVPFKVKVRGGAYSSHLYYGGEQPIIGIRSSRMELEGTPIHRVRIASSKWIQWKALKDIKIGDWVALDRSEQIMFNNPTYRTMATVGLSEEGFGHLIGKYLGGSGACCRWLISKNDVKTLQLYQENTRRVPEWAFRSNREFLVGLLSGLWEATGSVRKGTLNLMHQKRGLCQDIRDISQLFGLHPRIEEGSREVFDKTYSFYSVIYSELESHSFPIMSSVREQFKDILPERLQIPVEALEFTFSPVEEIWHSRGEVYDLTVPGTEEFMAGGLVNHNTTAAISLAYNASVKNKFKTVFLTLEIMKIHWWASLLSRHSAEIGEGDLSAQDLKKGLLEEDKFKSLDKVSESLHEETKKSLSVLQGDDFIDFSLTSMNRMWEKMKEDMGGLDMIIVDYIQLFKFYKLKGYTETEFVNYIIRYFSNLSVREGIIVVILSQVNRTGINQMERHNRANLTVLAEFNELERSSTLVILLHGTEALTLASQVNVSMPKNRLGPHFEEFIPTYVDPDHFVFGSSDLKGIINEGVLEDIDLGDTDDFF